MKVAAFVALWLLATAVTTPFAASGVSVAATAATSVSAGAAVTPIPRAAATTAPQAHDGISLEAGTLGAGGGYTHDFGNGTIDARLLSGFFKYAFDGTTASGVKYTGNIRLANALIVTDYHPGRGAFRIGAGLSVGGPQATVVGVPQPGGGFTIGGVGYPTAQVKSVAGSVRFDGAAPVVLLGFGDGLVHPGFSVDADLGVIFERPSTSVTTVYGPFPAGVDDPNTPQGAAFQQNVSSFRADLKSAASYLQTYPVLNVGLGYRF